MSGQPRDQQFVVIVGLGKDAEDHTFGSSSIYLPDSGSVARVAKLLETDETIIPSFSGRTRAPRDYVHPSSEENSSQVLQQLAQMARGAHADSQHAKMSVGRLHTTNEQLMRNITRGMSQSGSRRRPFVSKVITVPVPNEGVGNATGPASFVYSHYEHISGAHSLEGRLR